MQSRPLRILMLANLPPPLHGVNIVSEKIYHYLKNQSEISLKIKPLSLNVDLSNLGQSDLKKIGHILRLVGYLIQKIILQKREDIIYIPFTPRPKIFWRDCILAWLSKALARRIWIHNHGEGFDKILQKPLARFMLRGCECIAITEEAHKASVASGIFKTCWRLSNPAKTQHFRKQRETTLHLLYLANFKPEKGVILALDTLEALYKLGIPFTGDFAGDMSRSITESDMRHMIRARKLTRYITLHGPVEGTLKTDLFKKADIFLYPSRHDHAPLVILEAMAGGALPLTLATGGIAEIMGEELKQYVFPPDEGDHILAKKLAETIKSLVENRGDLRKEQALCRERQKTYFSDELFFSRLHHMLWAERFFEQKPDIHRIGS